MKIIQHCQQAYPTAVSGQLLGLDQEGTLDITYSFPIFVTRDDDDGEDEDYQVEFMRCLRDVHADNNTVGWYQSGHMGSFVNSFTVETQASYQEAMANSVFIVYDHVFYQNGSSLPLRAFRLSDDAFDLFKARKAG